MLFQPDQLYIVDSMNTIRFLHPEHLEPEAIASDIGMDTHHVASALDLIVERQLYETMYGLNEEGDTVYNRFVPVNATALKKTRGQKPYDALKKMASAGVLRRAPYSVGECPFSYVLSGDLNDQYTPGYQSFTRSKDVHHSAFDPMRRKLSRTTVDLVDDCEHLRAMAHTTMSVGFPDEVELNGMPGARSMHAVSRFLNRSLYVKQSGFAQRVYSHFAGAPSALRAQCTLGGDGLAEVDMSNAQWFLIAVDMLMEKNRPDVSEKLLAEATQLLNIASELSIPSYMLQARSSSAASRFLDITQSGQIYELIQEAVGLRYEKGCTRDQAKLCAQVFVNSTEADIDRETNRHGDPNTAHLLRIALEDNFPEVAEHVAMRREQLGDVRYGQYLNRLEVMGMVHTALPMMQSRGVQAITIHDAVAVRREDAGEAQSCVQSAFENLYGVAPTTHTD